MKQNIITIKLRKFTKDDHPHGRIQGREVFQKLINFVDAHPATKIFGISLEDIQATDASFPRESVVSLAKHYRGERGFYLEGFRNDQDLIDNWMYAARNKEQPLVIWSDEDPEIIGPEITSSTQEMVNYVLSNRSVTTAKVADDLGITVQNASTRLKKLVEQGYILRSETVAESGGIEYRYHAIK